MQRKRRIERGAQAQRAAHSRWPLGPTQALGCASLILSMGGFARGELASRMARTPRATGESDGTTAIVKDAYAYGYPMMVLDATKAGLFKGVTNRFAYLPASPTAEDHSVVRPNVDTLYALAFLDLAAQPVVVHAPDTRGRYYLMPMLDANTNVFASPGKRTTGTAEHDFVVVGPQSKGSVSVPANMTEIDAPTNMVWVLERTQWNGPDDTPTVNAIQRQFSIAPLSEWPKGAIPAAPLNEPEKQPETPPAEVASMKASEYFDRLAMLLRDNPPPPSDEDALRRFATIGLVPGQPFTPSEGVSSTLERAKTSALSTIKDRASDLGDHRNGWRWLLKGIGTYGTDYEERAAVTQYGLGANLPEDALYPSTRVDAKDEPLSGTRRYILHFDRDQMPPVEAFWSITMYDEDGYLVPNPLNRYAARDRFLEKNQDGTVDLYVQAESPGPGRETNWLPAPKDRPFTLTLRMYWPKDEVVKGTYEAPGVYPARGK